ncbi:BZ3500_MvSof-1268-A1-R1_Chr8-1g09819 [Microbotryum saponariae]|uniref:Conserved oligomeric Golgi complex subunit 1 n=1 Tax=Microbotryum saponariae TaxID=289078 RepID=A0A2X0MND7_9BASI|nr:BZ3500_MvSof-1268-A1-R1_Chr8-1g09819 [Microbotryum saponariae]SDA08105.1 BZ3501_MvSof-1269-A2-R1_Chr8-1g09542 [Microbotryum saponariae]
MTTPTTRTRGTSNASLQSLSSAAPLNNTAPVASTSGSPPRRGPPPALSRTGSSLADSPISRTGSKYGGASSIQALSPRYLTFSSAASNVGSVATSAAPGGPGGATRFKRGHVRKKAPAIIGIRSANPDEIDLMALEDPDEVFRRFGVRDVRGLEKRASDAAAGKVAELRTMVGERYRDLLSAADSIIRMRAAAEKLVDRFDKVETGISVGEQDNGPDNTPTKRVKHPKLAHRASLSSTKPDRTFASPPTLSLSIQLLLTLPSTVHSLLESGDFLPAARIEGLGRLVYRALSNFTSDGDDADGGIIAAFPIIEKQSEAINGLGPAITRRAIAELRTWDTPTLATANTLAAIVMLENASLPSSLATLLEARSKTLSAILYATGSSKSPDVDTILKRLNEALGVVLRTVDAASSIFGATSSPSTSKSLLAQLLQEIEQPTGLTNPTDPTKSDDDQSPRLVPIIHTLPNHALLARHLPLSILEYTPSLPMSPSNHPFNPSAAHSQVQSWLALETDRVVQGVTSWIAHLRGGARTLAQIRSTLRSSLAAFSGLRDAQADVAALEVSLNAALEARFEKFYRQHMRSLVDRVEPALSSALEKLPTSLPDLDTAEFLLETPLPFPKTSHYGVLPHMSTRANNNVAGLSAQSFSDTPFEAFLDQVNKRVIGRSPLIDHALSELEAHARDLRKDLQDWLESEDHGLDVQTRLRIAYVGSARDMLHSVYEALAALLGKHASSVTSSLFLGNVFHQISLSTTFTADLLHGTLPVAKSQGISTGAKSRPITESSIIAEWQSQLAELQQRSLGTWRIQAVERAADKLRDATSSDALRTATLKSREMVQGQQNGQQATAAHMALPMQPSPAVLSALRNLVSLIRKVGLHRTQTDPTIVRDLLDQVAEAALQSYQAFVAKMAQGDESPSEKREFANQVLWDVSFLGRIWNASQPGWIAVNEELRQLADPSLVSSVEASTLKYLQRTQTIFSSLLLVGSTPSSSLSSTTAAASAAGWLALGTVSAPSLALTGLGKPGPRLGQLPTRN